MSEETTTETIQHCWPWSHKWTKWEDYKKGSLLKSSNDEVGFVIFQEKRCVKCNKKHLRVTRTLITGGS